MTATQLRHTLQHNYNTYGKHYLDGPKPDDEAIDTHCTTNNTLQHTATRLQHDCNTTARHTPQHNYNTQGKHYLDGPESDDEDIDTHCTTTATHCNTTATQSQHKCNTQGKHYLDGPEPDDGKALFFLTVAAKVVL